MYLHKVVVCENHFGSVYLHRAIACDGPLSLPLTRNNFRSMYLHKVVVCEVVTEETTHPSLQAEDAL